jgi:hypothetical protein
MEWDRRGPCEPVPDHLSITTKHAARYRIRERTIRQGEQRYWRGGFVIDETCITLVDERKRPINRRAG